MKKLTLIIVTLVLVIGFSSLGHAKKASPSIYIKSISTSTSAPHCPWC